MNRIIVLILCVCFTNGKDMALKWQILSTSVTLLWIHKTEIHDDRDIGSSESPVSYDFQNLLTILLKFFKYTFKSSYILSYWYNVEKMVCTACLKPVSRKL